jgi:hypothetical protein
MEHCPLIMRRLVNNNELLTVLIHLQSVNKLKEAHGRFEILLFKYSSFFGIDIHRK